MSIELRIDLVNFFKGLFELESLLFKSSVQLENVIGDPSLVVFSDGSNIAYIACSYVRWQVGMENLEVTIIYSEESYITCFSSHVERK